MIPDWIHRIKKGDVLRSGSGRLRVVRDVSHNLVENHGRCEYLEDLDRERN